MRGFAVAAGGWDDAAPPPRAELHVVADAPVVEDPAPPVVDLDEHRRRVAGHVIDDGDSVIVAW